MINACAITQAITDFMHMQVSMPFLLSVYIIR